VNRALEVVDEYRPFDPELVAKAPRRGELVLDARMGRQVLARMRFPRVDEIPTEVGVALCELVEQRTLCGAVRSGERAELQHDARS
jgi:hypothetical protein